MTRRFFLTLALLIVPGLSFAVPQEDMVFKATKSEAANQKIIEAGIEKAIDGMSFITKPIARKKLQNSNIAFKSIGFKFPGDKVSIQHDARKTVDSPRNGGNAKGTREDGETFTVSQKVGEKDIVQIFYADEGVKTLKYDFSDDYKSMKVHIKLESPKLSGPLKYTLEYAR